MSNGVWDHANRVAIAAVAAFFAALLLYTVWGLAALHTKEAISASGRASQYDTQTEQQILESCTVPELAAMRECVAKHIQASEENQRASYNLAAQDAVARWTFWLLVLGLVGTGLTGVGLYYLDANIDEMKAGRIVTQAALDEAKKANEISRSVGQAQVRAYVTAIPPEMQPMGGPRYTDTVGFRCWFKWRNTGNSVAKNVRVNVARVICSIESPPSFLEFTDFSQPTMDYGVTEFTTGEWPVKFEEIKSAGRVGKRIWLLATVQYSDVFGSYYSYQEKICVEPAGEEIDVKFDGQGVLRGVGLRTEGRWREHGKQ